MVVMNLPATEVIVGRDVELADIMRLLSDSACRLLTLIGPGGIGKTRLAIQAAANQGSNFPHGVFFVPLAPVSSPDMIASAIANALGISFYGSEDPRLQIVPYLREKQILLVMDNFEHLLTGIDLLTDILQVAPGVKFLVTSRERLNLREEWVLTLDGLSFPKGQTSEPLENYSAVQLFLRRARQTQVSFSLAENAEGVQTICQQVEGMPLALELAATWLRAMSCRQIAVEMEGNLTFLTTPLRNVPDRHRSLKAVFEQSWALLSPAEKDVLMRLSIFRGGFDREAAEQVAGASLPLVAGLADKSLMRLNASGRYDLHELVRQYVADKLQEVGEENITAQRHCDYFLELAEGAEAHAFGREQVAWFDRVEVELDNLRGALTWSMNDETGLRLAAAMGWFFSERSHWIEGLNWMERIIAANQAAPDSLRAKALFSAGALAGLLDTYRWSGGERPARILCQQALALARKLNDPWTIAWSLSHMAIFAGCECDEQATLLDESLALFRNLEDPMGVAHTLIRRAWAALALKDYPYVRLLLAEAASRARDSGDKVIMAWATYDLGRVCWYEDHDLPQARTYFETSLSLFREAKSKFDNPHVMLADVELAMGNLARAQMHYEDALLVRRAASSDSPYLSFICAGLGSIARVRGQFERAGRLLSSAASGIGGILPPTTVNTTLATDIAALRTQLGETAFAEIWEAGKAMPREEVIDYALEGRTTLNEALLTVGAGNPETTQSRQTARRASTDPLSDRELEVLQLIAEGFSNGEIAEKLVIAMSTVKWHIHEIFAKLDVTSRTQAIVRARELRLLT